MSEAMIKRDDARLSITLTDAANDAKEKALEAAALVGKVTNAEEQQAAVDAQKEIARVLKLAEDARKAAKEPVLEYGLAIDETIKRFIVDLKDEQMRVAKLVADFQQLEQAKIRAAQQAENERLQAIERERMAERAKAKTHEALEKIDEKFNTKVQAEATPIPVQTKVEGQRITNEWQITVSDIWLLAKSHPTCVKIEPRLSEIKSLLDAGVKVAGVSASKQVKASVRVGREAAAISV